MAHDKCLELATKRCDCIKDTIDELQAENKKLKEQQLTEDEIRIIVFKSAITLNKEEAHRIAKATIKAREDKEVDPEDYVNRNWN